MHVLFVKKPVSHLICIARYFYLDLQRCNDSSTEAFMELLLTDFWGVRKASLIHFNLMD